MSTTEIINELRTAVLVGAGGLDHLLGEAADRLEELDERLAIEGEGELPHHTIYVDPNGTVSVTVYKGADDADQQTDDP